MCSRGLGNHCSNRSVIGILNHDGAFADYLIVPEQNLHAVPDEMSDDLATLVEPIAAALQIPEQVDLSPDTRAVVVGDGRLGNLCAQVLKNAKCNVTVVGRHEAKLRTFAALNMTTCHLDDAPTDRSADVVVDCSGSSTGLATALSFVRPRGTVVMKTTVAAKHEIALAPIVIDVAPGQATREVLAPSAVLPLVLAQPGAGPAHVEVVARHAGGQQPAYSEHRAVGEMDPPASRPGAVGMLLSAQPFARA